MCTYIYPLFHRQKNSLSDLTTEIPGGKAGHVVSAVKTAGCYAPGGRYPLPSSVLMTAITARVAGVKNVWVASPRPAIATMAAVAFAGLLVAIMRSDEVRGILEDLVRRALTVG